MVKIISDSTCDLSKELLEKYNIQILPLHILLGEAEYDDGQNITPDEIFAWSDAHKTTPKTSAPSLADAIRLLRPCAEAGQEAVCFSISGSMSTSCNVMRLAAEELGAGDRIRVVDSENLSTGIGLLVLEAADMAARGYSAARIAQETEALRPRVRASFVVDTLTYLYRGGRCSAVAAMAGGMLKLHPKIVVKDGAMDASKKYRGRPETVILSYVRDLEPQLRQARPNRVFITHSGCSPDIVGQVRSYLEGLQLFQEILETRAGGVISSHCGPGTLGVLFIDGKEPSHV
ncbi:MAG: DegV family protein [Eubacteriales bacterium]|nr:DegV family protein [Eubacteriales bacterium]